MERRSPLEHRGRHLRATSPAYLLVRMRGANAACGPRSGSDGGRTSTRRWPKASAGIDQRSGATEQDPKLIQGFCLSKDAGAVLMPQLVPDDGQTGRRPIDDVDRTGPGAPPTVSSRAPIARSDRNDLPKLAASKSLPKPPTALGCSRPRVPWCHN